MSEIKNLIMENEILREQNKQLAIKVNLLMKELKELKK